MSIVSSIQGVLPIPGGLVELGYAETSTGITVSGTSGAPTNTGLSVTCVCDGSPVMVEFGAAYVAPAAVAGEYVIGLLYMDGASQGRWFYVQNPVAGAAVLATPTFAQRRLTPAAGSHTFTLYAYRAANNGTISAGVGGGDNHQPTYIRVSKISQGSAGLIPTPIIPVVTQLPTNPRDGQEVLYQADGTNGIYWHLRYHAGAPGSYKWVFIGGHGLRGVGGQTATSTSNVYQALSTPCNVTVPLAGVYRWEWGGYLQQVQTGLCQINLGLYESTVVNQAAIHVGSAQYDLASVWALRDTTVATPNTTYSLRFATNSTVQGAAGDCQLIATPIRVG
jgi:hypothetical protein